jgi:hypothetical protein
VWELERGVNACRARCDRVDVQTIATPARDDAYRVLEA